jgi:histidine triad (HIT) family protein
MNNCLFCKIVNKEIPAKIVYENNDLVAFADINPQAPVHILIVPKKHIDTVDHLKPEDEKLIGNIIYTAQKIAREKGIAENGYRLVFNVRHHGGQEIDHIHLHILGGQRLGTMV